MALKLIYVPTLKSSRVDEKNLRQVVELTQDEVLSKPSSTIIKRLQRAATLASLGTCNFRHGAILMQSARVLNVGINSYSLDPDLLPNPSRAFREKVAQELETSDQVPAEVKGVFGSVEGKISTTHAERAAFSNHTHFSVPNLTLYVARISTSKVSLGSDNPTTLFSRPCKTCLAFLRKTPVKAVYYT